MDAMVVALISLISVVVSLFVSSYVSKQRNVVDAVTSKRMEQAYELREAMLDFIKEYLKKDDADHYVLSVAQAKIELYIRNFRDMYIGLKKQLDICSYTPFSEDNYNKLMIEMQSVLNYKWRRTKQEAGLKKEVDARVDDGFIQKMIEEKKVQYERYEAGKSD